LCEGCGLGRTDPLPSAAELGAFYREHYRVLYKGSAEPKPLHVLRNGRRAAERLRRLRPWLGAGGRWLDAGCGGGELVFLLNRAGCRACGVEPNRAYAEYARRHLGLEVHAGLIEDQDFAAASFDGICLFHVLEHVPDPAASLAVLARWLRPGGVLAVEVPNFESRAEHPLSRFHTAHLLHFCRETLTRTAHAAGLAVAHLETSADGGNLFAVCRPASGGGWPGEVENPAPRLLAAEAAPRRLRYWSSPRSLVRAMARLGRRAEEMVRVRGFESRRQILESLAEGW
jgi:2-polyprenyl-3-methyl-5-hydroxy-6-metoxy-1,4-benzoquinol methylase